MSSPASSPPASLAALRDRIRQIEAPARHGVLPFEVAAIDRALPGGGLALGAVHEILGQGGDEEDGAAAAGFVAGILARLGSNPPIIPLSRTAGEGARGRRPRAGEGIVLWCLKRPDLYGPGLLAHGLDPTRLLLLCAKRDDELLWGIEEGLRTPGLAAVVGEIGRLSMVAGRRLQLAAERSGITAFLLRRWRNGEEAMAKRERPSPAVTRWRVAVLPSDPHPSTASHRTPSPAGGAGVGWGRWIERPRWRVELLRCRGGGAAAWDLEVADATGHVSLFAALADRPAAPPRRETRRGDAEPFRRTG